VRHSLRQAERDPMPAVEQLAVLIAAMEGLVDGLEEQLLVDAMQRIRALAKKQLQEIEQRIADNKELRPEDSERVSAMVRAALEADLGTDVENRNGPIS
jgi:F-type H+-transporting ATPase subunit alpha